MNIRLHGILSVASPSLLSSIVAVPCAVAAHSQAMLNAASFQPIGHSFFLSPGGSDANDGLSPRRAWRSLEKLRGLHLSPGDRILLRGGAEFLGGIALSKNDAGTELRPIVIGSYGQGRGTIVSKEGPAILAAAGGLEIRDLIIKGGATKKAANHTGIALMASGSKGERYRHVRVENVDVSGFGDGGIVVGSVDGSGPGFEDVRITGVRAHDNYEGGIVVWEKAWDRPPQHSHRDLRITDCDCSNNLSGSGIVISGVDGALIEFSRASGNHGEGGGVGMWAWAASQVVFRQCIADRTRTNGGDGGGFDLDGGCVNCAIEECLAYDNDGPGFMHCDFPRSVPTRGNAIRTSISIDDGRKPGATTMGFGFVTWGSGLDGCRIEGNLALATAEADGNRTGGLFFVDYIVGSQGETDIPHVRGCTFARNVGSILGLGPAFVSNALPHAAVSDVRFESNLFRAAGGIHAEFLEAGKRFADLDAWRSATGQETRDGRARAVSGALHLPALTAASLPERPRDLLAFPLMRWLNARNTAGRR